MEFQRQNGKGRRKRKNVTLGTKEREIERVLRKAVLYKESDKLGKD